MGKRQIDVIYIGIFVIIMTTSFLWRFYAIPWDAGGCFLQVWITLISFAVVTSLSQRMARNEVSSGKAWFVIFLKIVALSVVSGSLFGTLYFAPQILFPCMALAGAVIVSLVLILGVMEASPPRVFPLSLRQGLIGGLIIVGLVFWCYSAKGYITRIVQLRNLAPTNIQAIQFRQFHGNREFMIENKQLLEDICEALQFTFPYSPNHEGIRERWDITILLTFGERLHFQLGKGNNAHPQTAWIEFGVHVYQNPQLPSVLSRANIPLWTDVSEKTTASE